MFKKFGKKVGKFFKKNIAKPIEKTVIKPVDKAIIDPIERVVVNPIREKTDKDFALKDERARLERAKADFLAARSEVMEVSQELELARLTYERVTENFRKMYGHGGAQTALPWIEDEGMPDNPLEGVGKVLETVGEVSRNVLKTVSLGLTEGIFNLAEIPKEREFLEAKTKEFRSATSQLDHAARAMRHSIKELEAATEKVRSRHAELGADATASDLQVHNAKSAAQIAVVERLVADDYPRDIILEMTGFDENIVDAALA